MTQDEIDARLAAIGGSKLVHTPIAARKTVKVTRKNSLGDPEEKDAEVTVQRWTNEATGHVLEAFQKDDGSWEIVKDDPRGSTPARAGRAETAPPGGKPFIDDGPEAGAAGRRWGWNPQTQAYDRDLGPSPSAQKPPEAPTAPKDEPNPNDPTRLRRWNPKANGGQGAYEDAGPNQAEIDRRKKEEEARAERNRPNATSTTVTRNGVTYIQHTVRSPGKPDEVYFTDQAGNRVQLPEEDGKDDFADIPAAAPRFTPDYDQDDLGLSEYFEELLEARRAGIIDKKQGSRLLQAAGNHATLTSSHGTTRRSQALTQRQQDLGEVQSRRTAAANLEQSVRASVDEMAKDLLPGSGATGQTVVDAYRAMLRMGQRAIEEMGGMRDVPPVSGMRGEQEEAVSPLNVSGSYSVPHVVMRPGGAIEINPPTGGAPAPTAAPVAAPAVAPAAAPVGAPGSGQRVDANDKEDRVPTVPVNPMPGEPGNDPTKPVGMMPGGGMGADGDAQKLQRLLDLGLDDGDARNVLALHKRGVRADQL